MHTCSRTIRRGGAAVLAAAAFAGCATTEPARSLLARKSRTPMGVRSTWTYRQAANATEAIERARKLSDSQRQEDYLLVQGDGFLKRGQYVDAAASAQYVLLNLDTNSQPAQDILARAESEFDHHTEQTIHHFSPVIQQAADNATR